MNALANSISKVRQTTNKIWACNNGGRRICSGPANDVNEKKEKELEKISKNASLDEPPTSCCQSGCANCVYIAWAEALTSKMETAGPEIIEKVMKSVDDPCMKAYLEMELRLRGLKK